MVTHTYRQREEEGEKERERRVWIAYIAFQTPSLLVSNDKRQHTTLTSLSRRRSRSAALRQTDDLRKKRRTGENFMNELAHQTKGSAQERGTEGGRERELTREPKKSPLQEAHLSTLCVCVCVGEREESVDAIE